MSAVRRSSGSWAVASPHTAATEEAAAVLAKGGTAIDAAICAAGVLTVVYPHNCSIGGDLIALVRHGSRPPEVVYGVGRSAGRLDVEAVRAAHDGRMPVAGPSTITVPGVVSGWMAMHGLGGSMPFARLLAPAADLAESGVAVSHSVAVALSELESDDPGIAQVFGPAGKRLAEGDTLVQSQLADTIALVAKDPDGYYRGELAARLAAGLASCGSPLRLGDLHDHQVTVSGAVETAPGPLAPRLFTAGLPSQGAFFPALVSAVGALARPGHDLLGRDGYLLARAFSAFTGVRDELVRDPAQLVTDAVVDDRLGRLRRLADTDPGTTDRAGQVVPGSSSLPKSGDTVAVVARDGDGSSVSLLQSVFHSFGSKILDPGTGVLFHNRGAMFKLEEGAPSQLRPGLRPPHTLCPIMVDGIPGAGSLALSTMGAFGQPQILSEVLISLGAAKTLHEAMEAPRFVVGGLVASEPNRFVVVEDGAPAELLESLLADGFDIQHASRFSEDTGHAQALAIGDDGTLQAASDPRADGSAICGR